MVECILCRQADQMNGRHLDQAVRMLIGDLAALVHPKAIPWEKMTELQKRQWLKKELHALSRLETH